MKIVLGAAAFIALSLAGPVGQTAVAQNYDVGRLAGNAYRLCFQSGSGARLECACVLGYFAGSMSVQQFQMFGILAPHLKTYGGNGDVSAARTELQAFRDKTGMTQAQYDAALDKLGEGEAIGIRADKICGPMNDLNR